MKNKYVIKNCPAFSIEPTKYGNVCRKWCSSKPCQKHTDCLLKQIVEKCKAEINLRPDINIDDDFTKEILELLDIQEIK